MYIADDQEKAQKFLQGLRKEVRQVLYAWNIRTYEDVEKATTTERNMVSQGELKLGGDAKVEDRNKDKLVNPSTVQFKRPNGAKFKKDRYCKKCQKRHAGKKCGAATKGAGSYNCGELGHFFRDCPSKKPLKILDAPKKEVICFACNQPGHYSRNCPQGGKAEQGKKFEGKSSSQPTRVYHLTKREAKVDLSIVEGTLLIHATLVHTLVDPGATHSFIAITSARSFGLEPLVMNYRVKVQSPIGKTMETNLMIHGCDVEVEGEKFEIDLILMEIQDYEVILGMDFLSRYCATMDCLQKIVRLGCPGGKTVEFRGQLVKNRLKIVSAIRASKLLKKGAYGYIGHVVVTGELEKKPKDVEVVKEFVNVFPEELSGLPPDQEVEFTIELLSGTNPISIPTY